jgi:catechol 2,3-dioxygenase-like lactoylglutathione lyase family enzyme
MVTLNRAVAVGMARRPHAGLALLATLEADERIASHHRLEAVRAHLLERAGDLDAARASYRAAALGARLPAPVTMADSFKSATPAVPSIAGMQIEFIASMAVITPDPAQSRGLYVDALGLPLKAAEGDEYVHSEKIEGSKHFGVWPLSQAAQACFGSPEWPADRPVPQASVEFEVADPEAVRAAGEELEVAGFTLLHPAREEPWGQTVARLQSLEGAIIGISYAPWLHA